MLLTIGTSYKCRRQLSITTDLGDADRAHRIRHRRALRDQHVHLAQLGNNLFGRVSLLAHRDPPIGSREPYFRADHFTGGGSVPRAHAQQAVPTVGFLNSASPVGYASMASAFRQGPKEAGYIE